MSNTIVDDFTREPIRITSDKKLGNLPDKCCICLSDKELRFHEKKIPTKGNYFPETVFVPYCKEHYVHIISLEKFRKFMKLSVPLSIAICIVSFIIGVQLFNTGKLSDSTKSILVIIGLVPGLVVLPILSPIVYARLKNNIPKKVREYFKTSGAGLSVERSDDGKYVYVFHNKTYGELIKNLINGGHELGNQQVAASRRPEKKPDIRITSNRFDSLSREASDHISKWMLHVLQCSNDYPMPSAQAVTAIEGGTFLMSDALLSSIQHLDEELSLGGVLASVFIDLEGCIYRFKRSPDGLGFQKLGKKMQEASEFLKKLRAERIEEEVIVHAPEHVPTAADLSDTGDTISGNPIDNEQRDEDKKVSDAGKLLTRTEHFLLFSIEVPIPGFMMIIKESLIRQIHSQTGGTLEQAAKTIAGQLFAVWRKTASKDQILQMGTTVSENSWVERYPLTSSAIVLNDLPPSWEVPVYVIAWAL